MPHGGSQCALAFFDVCIALLGLATCAAACRRSRATNRTLRSTYYDLAEHYGVAVLSSHASSPKENLRQERRVG